MSILIKGMEMPKSCALCPCGDDESRFCKAANEYIPTMLVFPKFCPLVYIPSADVQPVVHGHWDDTITGVDGLYCCSACKNFETVDGGLNYCPNCGARMVNDDG